MGVFIVGVALSLIVAPKAIRYLRSKPTLTWREQKVIDGHDRAARREELWHAQFTPPTEIDSPIDATIRADRDGLNSSRNCSETPRAGSATGSA